MCTENLALHKPAWQSNTMSSANGAELAVDGLSTNLNYYEGTCATSNGVETTEWRVDLGGIKNIHHVILHQAAHSKSMLCIISIKITRCHQNRSIF